MRKLTRNLLRSAAAMALCAAAGMSHATPVTFDIVFLLDASGSVGSVQFRSERQLINTIHDQFVALAPADHSVNYRFGVIEFATTASVKQHLNTAYSATLVSNLNYVMGYSALKGAVQGGLDLFSSEGAASDIRQMFLLTDGIPNPTSSQNPSSLAPALDAANVNVTVLGLQDFNDVIVHSLVDDRARRNHGDQLHGRKHEGDQRPPADAGTRTGGGRARAGLAGAAAGGPGCGCAAGAPPS